MSSSSVDSFVCVFYKPQTHASVNKTKQKIYQRLSSCKLSMTKDWYILANKSKQPYKVIASIMSKIVSNTEIFVWLTCKHITIGFE